jgi:hypothetical protein
MDGRLVRLNRRVNGSPNVFGPAPDFVLFPYGYRDRTGLTIRHDQKSQSRPQRAYRPSPTRWGN